MKHFLHKIWPLVLACAVLCMNVVPVYAYSDSTSVSNQGRIGAVDIELHQSFPAETVMVTPGQKVSIKSAVENKGQPAWVRIKLEYPTSNALEVLDDSLITFADGAWKKIGDYYYLTEAMATGKTVAFTEALQFPSDWDNEMVNTTVGMVFTVEAIQKKNFDPDFTSKDPWYGAVIEAYDSGYYQVKEEGVEKFSVVYKSGAEGLVHLGDDFFSNWGDLMPGDELDGSAVIENRMNLPVRIYFGMENSGDASILKALTIKIENGSDVVYNGPLSGSISPAVLLKEYATGEKTTFKYHISVPKDLDNDYALSDFKVVWTFSAEEVLPEKKPSIIEVIKTGEYNLVIGIVGVGIAAVSAGVLLLRKRKGERGHE